MMAAPPEGEDSDTEAFYRGLGCFIEEGAQEKPGALLFPTSEDMENLTVDSAKVLDVHISPDSSKFIKVRTPPLLLELPASVDGGAGLYGCSPNLPARPSAFHPAPPPGEPPPSDR